MALLALAFGMTKEEAVEASSKGGGVMGIDPPTTRLSGIGRTTTSHLRTLVTAEKVEEPAAAGKTEQEAAIEVQLVQAEQSGTAGTPGQGSADEVQAMELEVQAVQVEVQRE